jgi:F420H(2)-dependent quinone reductase
VSYLVVASKGGAPEAPGWYHNLKAKHKVEINVGPRRFAVTAGPALPDDPDYPRLWRIVNKNNQNRYIEYQKRTSRPIPVVVLTPKG